MSEFGTNLMQVMNMSPIFKGGSVLAAGLLALIFAWWMKSKWQEPLKAGFLIFIGFAVFIVLYGLYVLVFQPAWWQLPY
ncbi:MAG: hypothetical protein ABH823_04685 [bacterium]